MGPMGVAAHFEGSLSVMFQHVVHGFPGSGRVDLLRTRIKTGLQAGSQEVNSEVHEQPIEPPQLEQIKRWFSRWRKRGQRGSGSS